MCIVNGPTPHLKDEDENKMVNVQLNGHNRHSDRLDPLALGRAVIFAQIDRGV